VSAVLTPFIARLNAVFTIFSTYKQTDVNRQCLSKNKGTHATLIVR